jgi:hypothetical protein
MFSRRQLVFTACFLVLPILLWQFASLNEEFSLPRAGLAICSAILPAKDDDTHMHSTPQKRHRVAVASTFGFHHDVYMSLVWTLQRVMGRSPTGGTVEVYAPFPFGFEFQTIVETLQLYEGQVKSPELLIEAINSNMGDGGIDLVVLGTCEVECVA